jgi:hypothetical protein
MIKKWERKINVMTESTGSGQRSTGGTISVPVGDHSGQWLAGGTVPVSASDRKWRKKGDRRRSPVVFSCTAAYGCAETGCVDCCYGPKVDGELKDAKGKGVEASSSPGSCLESGVPSESPLKSCVAKLQAGCECSDEIIECIVKIKDEAETDLQRNILQMVEEAVKKNSEELRPLSTIEPQGLSMVEGIDGWVELLFAVDSGATEIVVGEDMLNTVKTQEGPAQRRGVVYEVANGVRIPNWGEKRFVGVSNEGIERGMTAQVCDVNKALLSVKKIVAAGNRVVFEDEGSYIQDKMTGQCMCIEEVGGMYMLRMWVKGF